MQDPRARRAVAIAVATVTAVLAAGCAPLGSEDSGQAVGGADTLAEATSQDRPAAPAAAPEPVGAGRTVPGPDGWLTYTDTSQTWQVDVPAPLQELNVGEGSTNLTAVHGRATYGLEWATTGGTLDLLGTAEAAMDLMATDTAAGSSGEVDRRNTAVEATLVGAIDAVRFSTDIHLGADLLRFSGVLFQLRGDLVSAYVLDYGGASPLEADRFLSSLRTLS